MTPASIAKIRRAVADYMESEGCSCCQDWDAHQTHKAVLATLLDVEPFADGFGYNFRKYASSSKWEEATVKK